MSTRDEIDLLKPTLDERDDVEGVEAPWDPSGIVMATFFGGALAGGLLFAENFRRLRRKKEAWICLGVGIILLILEVGIRVWMIAAGYVVEGEHRTLMRWGPKVPYVALALIVARLQRRIVRSYIFAGNEPARVLLPALSAIVVNLVAVLLLGAIWALIWAIVYVGAE